MELKMRTAGTQAQNSIQTVTNTKIKKIVTIEAVWKQEADFYVNAPVSLPEYYCIKMMICCPDVISKGCLSNEIPRISSYLTGAPPI